MRFYVPDFEWRVGKGFEMFNNHNALLKKAAQRFENASYVDGNFMVEYEVDYDDGASLLSEMAMIIQGFLRAPKDIQMAIIVAGVMPSDRAGKIAFQTTRDDTNLQDLMLKLEQLNLCDTGAEIDCMHWFET